jgi:hypothetical protein
VRAQERESARERRREKEREGERRREQEREGERRREKERAGEPGGLGAESCDKEEAREDEHSSEESIQHKHAERGQPNHVEHVSQRQRRHACAKKKNLSLVLCRAFFVFE